MSTRKYVFGYEKLKINKIESKIDHAPRNIKFSLNTKKSFCFNKYNLLGALTSTYR